MLELASKGFPHNGFYALDMNGVMPSDVESFFQDGLRNFRSRVNCRFISVRSAISGKPEVKLFLAPNLDASDDELIISKMKEALSFFSHRFGSYADCFIILQEWTADDDYLFSLNLMPLSNSFIIEAVKGNHFNLDRAENPPTIIKFSDKGNSLISAGSLRPDDLMLLNRHVKSLFNNHFFNTGSVYELSILKQRPSFYQIKKPGELFKNPLSKKDFYSKLTANNIPFKSLILRASNL